MMNWRKQEQREQGQREQEQREQTALGKIRQRLVQVATTVAVMTAAMLVPLSAAQAEDEPVFYVSPSFKTVHFNEESMLENRDTGFHLALGVDLDRYWSAELGFQQLNARYANEQTQADVDSWQIDARYSLGEPQDRVRPYLSAGIGTMNLDGDHDSFLSLGGGFSFALGDRATVRAGVHNASHFARGLGNFDVGFHAGLAFYFGERSASLPQVASAEPESGTGSGTGTGSSPGAEPVSAPTVAVAPVDSDGDGVVDAEDGCADTPSNYVVDENGCPILVEEIVRFDLQVNFDFDRSVVRAEDIAEIEALSEFMREYDVVLVLLEGHTDSIGTESYNLGLSQRRADAVRNMLIEDFGIAPGRIQTEGFGEQMPVADNDTEQGRQANRRVVAVLAETLQRYQER